MSKKQGDRILRIVESFLILFVYWVKMKKIVRLTYAKEIMILTCAKDNLHAGQANFICAYIQLMALRK